MTAGALGIPEGDFSRPGSPVEGPSSDGGTRRRFSTGSSVNRTMDDFDRILSSEDTLEPSSGFENRVMEAVREAAAAPPPLPFPWGRFVLGLVAWAAWAAATVGLARQIDASVVSQLGAVAPEFGYAAVAVLASLATLLARRVLARRVRTRRFILETETPDLLISCYSLQAYELGSVPHAGLASCRSAAHGVA